MSTKEAVKGNFLKDKKVYLRLLPKPSELAKNPGHAAYGGFDGSLRAFTIGVDENNNWIDPFDSDDEREFFEKMFKTDLSVLNKDNPYWKKYSFTVIKSPELIRIGREFNLAKAKDMLDYKVLLTNKLVAKSWETKTPFQMFAFIDGDFEEVEAEKEADENANIYIFLGEMKDSPKKMKAFLQIYYTTNRINNKVPVNASKEFMVKEIQKIIKNDRKGYVELMTDPNYDTKTFIERAISTGVITVEGLGTFYITGLTGEGFSYESLIATIDKMKKEKKDPLYFKMTGQIEKAEEN